MAMAMAMAARALATEIDSLMLLQGTPVRGDLDLRRSPTSKRRWPSVALVSEPCD
jgi:hypothetical protein